MTLRVQVFHQQTLAALDRDPGRPATRQPDRWCIVLPADRTARR